MSDRKLRQFKGLLALSSKKGPVVVEGQDYHIFCCPYAPGEKIKEVAQKCSLVIKATWVQYHTLFPDTTSPRNGRRRVTGKDWELSLRVWHSTADGTIRLEEGYPYLTLVGTKVNIEKALIMLTAHNPVYKEVSPYKAN
jgi:hypothetical protein